VSTLFTDPVILSNYFDGAVRKQFLVLIREKFEIKGWTTQ
jgi:hypothetical protein